MADEPIFDKALWQHERQTVDDTDFPALEHQAVEQRRKESEARASRGDRTDWKHHLQAGLPRGYRLVPNHSLSQGAKIARAKALKAAIERRDKRAGVPIIRSHRHGFRDPQREARFYGIDPKGVTEAPRVRRYYYPDERRTGAYPFEAALDQLTDWVDLTFAGNDPIVLHAMAWRHKMRENEKASYSWTGEFPEYGSYLRGETA